MLSCTIYSPLSFYALMLLAALLMYREWTPLTLSMPLLNRLGGLFYVGIPVLAMMALRGQADPRLLSAEALPLADTSTPFYVLALFAMVWATDIGAYFGGKWKGKHKLIPSISPNKTWEGLGFGIVSASLAGLLMAAFRSDLLNLWQGLGFGAVLAVVSQMGDLFESWLKRKAGVKDSGTLIPGHGGILDRVDGLVFAAPVFAALVLL